MFAMCRKAQREGVAMLRRTLIVFTSLALCLGLMLSVTLASQGADVLTTRDWRRRLQVTAK